jgi:hypothetical protein
MKRFRRWLFNWLTAVSLICFVVAIGLWVRALSASDTFYWSSSSNSRMVWVYWVNGSLETEFISGNVSWGINPGFHFMTNFFPDIPVWAFIAKPNGWRYEFLGVGVAHWIPGRFVPAYVYSETLFVLPLWVAAVLTGTLPAIAGVECWKRRKRISGGLCRNCGYDLRATPDGCPECGTIPPAKKEIISN